MDLSATELIDAARQIEAAGEAFYRAALAHVRHPDARDVFAWLVAEEARHADVFEEMLSSVARTAADWRDDEQYLGYLRALVEGHVFPSPQAARDEAARIGADGDAIELAVRFERDTIEFLQALRPRVREADRTLVDRLVQEESGHVCALEELAARRG